MEITVLGNKELQYASVLLNKRIVFNNEIAQYTLTTRHWILYHYLFLQYCNTHKQQNVGIVTSAEGLYGDNREGEKGEKWRKPCTYKTI